MTSLYPFLDFFSCSPNHPQIVVVGQQHPQGGEKGVRGHARGQSQALRKGIPPRLIFHGLFLGEESPFIIEFIMIFEKKVVICFYAFKFRPLSFGGGCLVNIV